MAITVSGFYLKTWRDMINGTQLAVDLANDDIKCALFPLSTVTPDYTLTGASAYATAPYTTGNEIAGTGNYTQGGKSLTTKAFAENPTGTLIYSADSVSWTSSTITNAGAALIYDNTLAGKNALCLVYFGGSYSTTAGTFTVQWQSSGILSLDLA